MPPPYDSVKLHSGEALFETSVFIHGEEWQLSVST